MKSSVIAGSRQGGLDHCSAVSSLGGKTQSPEAKRKRSKPHTVYDIRLRSTNSSSFHVARPYTIKSHERGCVWGVHARGSE
jgi:hypothetical protein